MCALGNMLRIAGLIIAVITTIGFVITAAQLRMVATTDQAIILIVTGAAIGATTGGLIAGVGQALIYLRKIVDRPNPTPDLPQT